MPLASPRRRGSLRALLALVAALCVSPTFAQPFPAKPITLVLPFPPGGLFDPVFRTLGAAASQDLGQPVVLLHKPGAGGVLGTAQLATMSEADGYTLAVMHNSVIRQPLLQKTPWDPLKDFTYIVRLADLVTGIAVAADSPWKTLPELFDDARKKPPGILTWGNVGAISVNRIVAERLAKSAGVSFNMVPFKGGAESFQALIGRHLDVYGDPGFGPQVAGGKVRLLAVFTSARLKRFPNVPTVKELGYDFVIESPVGLVAPRGLDAKVEARLQAAFMKAAGDAEYLKQLDNFDMQASVMPGEGYLGYARGQMEKERRMLGESGFKGE